MSKYPNPVAVHLVELPGGHGTVEIEAHSLGHAHSRFAAMLPAGAVLGGLRTTLTGGTATVTTGAGSYDVVITRTQAAPQPAPACGVHGMITAAGSADCPACGEPLAG